MPFSAVVKSTSQRFCTSPSRFFFKLTSIDGFNLKRVERNETISVLFYRDQASGKAQATSEFKIQIIVNWVEDQKGGERDRERFTKKQF